MIRKSFNTGCLSAKFSDPIEATIEDIKKVLGLTGPLGREVHA